MNELFGYSLFTEQKEPLRSYNRCITISNMVEGGHESRAEDYFNQFDKSEAANILSMANMIRQEGIDAVHKHVVKEVSWGEV